MNEETEVCLTPTCAQPAQWKGLCPACYGQAKRIMEEHDLSWRDLEKLGLVKLEYKPFTQAFYDAAAKAAK